MRRIISIHVNDRRKQQFAAMAVRVEQIDVIGMADPMLAGTVLDIVAATELAHGVASAQHGLDVGNDIAEMVERRSVALEEYEIVRRVFHLKENADGMTAGRDVVRNP